MLDHPEGIVKEAYKVAEFIMDERKESAKYLEYSDEDLVNALMKMDKKVFPVRYKFIETEIKNRDFERSVDNFDDGSIKVATISSKMKFSSFLKYRKRPDVSFKIQGYSPHEFRQISDEDFHSLLFNRENPEVLVIEDNRIRLFIHFDYSEVEYGFKLFYLDKYKNMEYKSILHGLSDDFTFQVIFNFIESGKTELQILKWNEVRNSTLRTLIANLHLVPIWIFIVAVAFLSLESSFLSSGISAIVDEFIQANSFYFPALMLFTIILSVFKDRYQLANLDKLSTKEVIDTLSGVFMIPFLALLIYSLLT